MSEDIIKLRRSNNLYSKKFKLLKQEIEKLKPKNTEYQNNLMNNINEDNLSHTIVKDIAVNKKEVAHHIN